jgi:1-acyl-sn-glycerol-3-phosphate acyltransferase
MAAIPVEFHFVAKRALLQYPLIGTVIRKAEHITIEKAGLSDRLAGADEVERQLRDGERLVIFAEGTFVRRSGLLPFRLGAFRAAIDTGRPLSQSPSLAPAASSRMERGCFVTRPSP